MKLDSRVFTAALASAVFLAPGLAAQDTATITAELGYRSDYLFAGIPFAEGGVTQATVSVGVSSFTVNGFAVFDHELGGMSEADIYGDWYVQASPLVGAFVGAGLYTFKIAGEWESTPELYAGLVLSTPLSPTLYVAHDFDLGDGTHAMLLLSHAVPLGESGTTLNLGGRLDYNDGYYTTISAFSFADLAVTLDVPLGPVTVTPLIRIQRAIHETFVHEEVFGLTASYTF